MQEPDNKEGTMIYVVLKHCMVDIRHRLISASTSTKNIYSIVSKLAT